MSDTKSLFISIQTQGGLVGSAPPPVAPKKFTIKRNPGGFDSGNDYVEIVEVMFYFKVVVILSLLVHAAAIVE